MDFAGRVAPAPLVRYTLALAASEKPVALLTGAAGFFVVEGPAFARSAETCYGSRMKSTTAEEANEMNTEHKARVLSPDQARTFARTFYEEGDHAKGEDLLDPIVRQAIEDRVAYRKVEAGRGQKSLYEVLVDGDVVGLVASSPYSRGWEHAEADGVGGVDEFGRTRFEFDYLDDSRWQATYFLLSSVARSEGRILVTSAEIR